ncbi:hypothetical protein B0I35DRAFT_484853 [Stachybotrys elegans]|uniref:Uncharacterized protein n=1 Tax=Stachybotrys elegans TaxID=80388 RepID=A0A8K0SHG5_9HYPO|nr:hypothetical protein B0I35DRAFT_484853 [Stachybotrys elegans]
MPSMEHQKPFTYDDSPEVVLPDSSPQVASPYQAEHSMRFEAANGKYLLGNEERDLSDQYPQVRSLAVDPSKHELSSTKYTDPPSAEKQDKEKQAGGRILGIKRKSFIIMTIVLLVVIAVHNIGADREYFREPPGSYKYQLPGSDNHRITNILNTKPLRDVLK